MMRSCSGDWQCVDCAFGRRRSRRGADVFAGAKGRVTRCDSLFGGRLVCWYETGYDLLGRPTNATDSVSFARKWLYNRRSELAAANVGTNRYGYAYDSIGNRLWSAENAATNTYAANALNQYTAISVITNLAYDADGNMTCDGTLSYSYDAENRLIAVYPLSPVVGSRAVVNRYDHRHRRVQKIVKQYDGATWGSQSAHTFVWDGMNVVLEKVAFADRPRRLPATVLQPLPRPLAQPRPDRGRGRNQFVLTGKQQSSNWH